MPKGAEVGSFQFLEDPFHVIGSHACRRSKRATIVVPEEFFPLRLCFWFDFWGAEEYFISDESEYGFQLQHPFSRPMITTGFENVWWRIEPTNLRGVQMWEAAK